MLRLGVMCGSATAGHPGTELFRLDEIAQLGDRVEVTTLDV
jgi:fructose-1-phosphate kinase PfkB-like protein